MRGTINGVRYDESTGTADRKIAEGYRLKREQEIHSEAIHGKAVKASFADAAKHYIENGGTERFLSPALRHFGKMPLRSIGQAQLDAAAIKLYPGRKGSTLNRQVYAPVSAVLHHASRLGWCPPPAIRRPKATPARVRWLPKDDADKLIASSNPSLRRLVLFLLYTGARVGEAVWLDWRDIDLERRQVMFTNTKNGTSRGVPLHSRVVEALRTTEHREGPVFLTPKGNPYCRPQADQDTDVSAGTRIKSAFRTACKRAGIVDFHPHDCRHTWATWHYMANRDIGALMRLGGWKTMSMAMRYAHTNVDEHAASIDRL